MFKAFIISVGFIFVLSPQAYCMIGQEEGFQITSENVVSSPGLAGSSNGSNYAIVGQNNAAVFGGANFTIVLQSETGILNQVASAVGLSAKLTGKQEGKINGNQAQNSVPGGSQQNQEKEIILKQELDKKGNTGAIIAGQVGIIGQVQIKADISGISGNAGFAAMSQFGGLIGIEQFNTELNKILTIKTGN